MAHWLGHHAHSLKQAGFEIEHDGEHTVHVKENGKRVGTIQNTLGKVGHFDVEGVRSSKLASHLSTHGKAGKASEGSYRLPKSSQHSEQQDDLAEYDSAKDPFAHVPATIAVAGPVIYPPIAMRAVEEDTKQFSELGDKALSDYGYKLHRNTEGRKIYGHKSGHIIATDHPASNVWEHYADNGKKYHSGKGWSELKKHLDKLHGSQHSEENAEQFAELPHHALLNAHGWNDTGKSYGSLNGSNHSKKYLHKKADGVIEHWRNGSWEHSHAGKIIKEGSGKHDLQTHLKSIR